MGGFGADFVVEEGWAGRGCGRDDFVGYADIFGFTPHGKGAVSYGPAALEPFERRGFESCGRGEGGFVFSGGAERYWSGDGFGGGGGVYDHRSAAW